MEPLNNLTTFENQVAILTEFWEEYRDDENFEDFVFYNDLGLPFAYGLANNIIIANEKTKEFVEVTFQLLLKVLDQRDTGFESLAEVLRIEE